MIQNGGTLHSFHEDEIGELLAKRIGRIFAEKNNPLSPKLADKHAIWKMNLSSMEVSMF